MLAVECPIKAAKVSPLDEPQKKTARDDCDLICYGRSVQSDNGHVNRDAAKSVKVGL